jgi:hypothetical protein
MDGRTHARRALPRWLTAAMRRTVGRRSRVHRGLAADERGQAAFLMLGIMAFFMILGFIAVNWGMLVGSRTSAQRAADAATLAGCVDLPNTAAASAAAISYGDVKNSPAGGTLEGGNTSTPSFSSVPDPNLPAGTTNRIRVDVSRTNELLGFNGLGIGPKTIGAHAICQKEAGLVPGLLALGTTGCQPPTFNFSGGATVDLGKSSAVANCDPSGMSIQGGATVEGKYLVTPSGQVNMPGNATTTASPFPGSIPDPYANLPAPDFPATLSLMEQNTPQPRAGCTYTPRGQQTQPTPRSPMVCHAIPGATLEAGIHWGGVEIPDDATVTLEANQIYQMAGNGQNGGLMLGTRATLRGNGVLIYNRRDPYPQSRPNQNCGPINIGQDSQFALTPPTSGPYSSGDSGYPGVILFQARDCNDANAQFPGCGGTSTNSRTATIGAGSEVGVASAPGGIYLPNTAACFTPAVCSPGTTMHVVLVSEEINITGCVTFDVEIWSDSLFLGDFRLID